MENVVYYASKTNVVFVVFAHTAQVRAYFFDANPSVICWENVLIVKLKFDKDTFLNIEHSVNYPDECNTSLGLNICVSKTVIHILMKNRQDWKEHGFTICKIIYFNVELILF